MKIKRIFAALIAVMLCIAAFPLTASAESDIDEADTGAIPEISVGIVETEEAADPQPLTPEGNMSLVDDIEGEAAEDKQFITVVSRNGNYFYIIVDRAADGENTVHFLNQVDEADLLALMEEDGTETETAAVCICTTKCEAGSVNTACAVCTVDMKQCLGTEPEPVTDPDADPEPEEESGGGAGGAIIFVLLLAVLGGGAFYYFKVLKNKPKSKSHSDLDDYDFGDDDDADVGDNDDDSGPTAPDDTEDSDG